MSIDRRYVALGCEYLAISIEETGRYMPNLTRSFCQSHYMITALMLIYDADINQCDFPTITTLLLLEAKYQRDFSRKEK